MDYKYIGYTEDRKVVKGTLAAANQNVAAQVLNRQGYQVLSLKPVAAFIPSWEQAFPSLFRIKPQVIVFFSRQLALLLESGTDIVTALELLQSQASSRTFRKVLGEVVSDLRGGNRLSFALQKHADVFPPVYRRSLSVGEQTGGMETVLRQIADYMEQDINSAKTVKNALTYPIIVAVVAIAVVAVLVTFVLPTFTNLYSSLNVELPLATKLLISLVDGLRANGVYVLIGLGAAVVLIFAYIKTPAGKYQWDKLSLKMPLLGGINLLNELARCCRSMSLLFRAGLP